jgi:hypothetical protein
LEVAAQSKISKEDFVEEICGGGRGLSPSPGSAKKMKGKQERYQQNNAEYQKLVA